MFNKDNLRHILKPEHLKAGLYLEESEDFLFLKRQGCVIQSYSAISVKIAEIFKDADNYIETLKAVEFVPSSSDNIAADLGHKVNNKLDARSEIIRLLNLAQQDKLSVLSLKRYYTVTPKHIEN